MELDKHTITRLIHISSPLWDQQLSIPLNEHFTIASLKKTIQVKHPRHPLPKYQLVTFHGKTLLDTETLFDILDQIDTSTAPSFHLAVVVENPPLTRSGSSTNTPYSSLSSNYNSASPPVVQPIISSTTTTPVHTSLTAVEPLLPPMTVYQVIAINEHLYLAPVLVPAYNSLPSYSATEPPASAPTVARDGNQSRARQRNTRLSIVLKWVVVLFLVFYNGSLDKTLFIIVLSLLIFMYRRGPIRLVIRRVPLQNGQPGGGDDNAHGQLTEQQGIPSQQPPLVPQENHRSEYSASSLPLNQPELDPNQAQQPQYQSGQTVQPTAPAPTSGTTSTQIATTPQERLSLPDPELLPNGTDNSITTTRLSVLKRAVFIFVASLWPNYGRGTRLA
ncbi:hypothetical protein BCR42DRAFT_411247 [Absidia repens]|uniref:Ubiquitin-like domain-containing protein n=1 Tax=Absidia repens TaxID=90262 RepID=A0A1X2ILF5_9FUNG|nr:hypothetical protein BCR42DRAFT_411247 [Absidia repens]